MNAHLDFAEKLADAAAQASLRHFRTPVQVHNKAKSGGGFDPLTQADLEAERAMRALIEAQFPDHGIDGEELPPRPAQIGQPSWILDPIDGTRNYMSGSLFWCTLIGLRLDGELIAGLIDHPATGERFAAEGGQGWWRRTGSLIGGDSARPLKTRPCAALADAVLGATTPAMFDSPPARSAFDAIAAQTRITLYGGNAYFYGLLALGHLDLVIESSLTRFDVGALIPIVRAGGGIMTDWRGGDPQGGGRVIAAGDRAVHEQALKILRQVQ